MPGSRATDASRRSRNRMNSWCRRPPAALADHPPGRHVQRGERRRGPVADVVVRPPLRAAAGHHRQQRLRAARRLHLRLLVDRQHDGPGRRGQVQPDHVPHLLDEVRVGRQLEPVLPVRLEPERPPDPADGRLGQAAGRGHPPRAPVGRGRRFGLRRPGDDPLDVRVGDAPRGARPRLVRQPVEPAGDEPGPPGADGRGAEAQPPGHDAVVRLVGAGEDDAGALREPLDALGPPGDGLELLPLVVGQDQCGFRTWHARTIPTASYEREQIKRTFDSGH